MTKTVTTLDEIRAQAEPQLVDLPGFREGMVVTVRLRMVDLTPRLMMLKLGNPLLASVQKLAKEGLGREEIADRLDGDDGHIREMLPLLDEIAKEALVEPTYDDIVAIQPLTLGQKMKIFDFVTGLDDLKPFRSE